MRGESNINPFSKVRIGSHSKKIYTVNIPEGRGRKCYKNTKKKGGGGEKKKKKKRGGGVFWKPLPKKKGKRGEKKKKGGGVFSSPKG